MQMQKETPAGGDRPGRQMIKQDAVINSNYTTVCDKNLSKRDRQDVLDVEMVSVFSGAFDPIPKGQVSIASVLNDIQSGLYRKQIEELRHILSENENRYKKAKNQLSAVTFSGTFRHRNIQPENLQSATGFIIADIDRLEDVEETFDLLIRDENIWFAFRSPSGKGIKAGLRADGIKSDADHKRLYSAVERYFIEVYQIEIDSACKDISRLTYVSYDPLLYINPEPCLFDIKAWWRSGTEQEQHIKLPPVTGTGKEKYARKVLESCCKAIRESRPEDKQMHATRYTRARLAGGYIQYLDESEIYGALEAAVMESATSNRAAALRTIKDGIERGKKSPITIPDIAPEHSAVATGQQQLPDPLPLLRESDSADLYPANCPGAVMGPAVRRAMEIIQAPDGICAHSFLATANLCIQGLANIEIDGRIMPASEYFLSIADSGERKSGVDDVALKAVRQWEEEQIRLYQRDFAAYRDEMEAYESQKRKILNKKNISFEDQQRQLGQLRGQEPEKPFDPKRIITDPTYEGIVKLFERGLPSTGLFSDEGGMFTGGFSMSAEKQLYTATGLSRLWGGASIDRIRSGGESFTLFNRRLSLHLMMQGGVAGEFFSNPRLRDQGLTGRMLAVWPNSVVGTRKYHEIDVYQEPEIISFHKRVSEILNRPLCLRIDKQTGRQLNELDLQSIGLTQTAKAHWIDFYSQVEASSGRNRIFECIPGFSNKAAEHCLRLAGILSLFDDPGCRAIDLPAIQSAATLMEHYLNERVRIREIHSPDPEILRAMELLSWIKARAMQVVTLPDVYQHGPSKLRTSKAARPVIKTLEDHYYVQKIEGGGFSRITGKKSREAWEVRQ